MPILRGSKPVYSMSEEGLKALKPVFKKTCSFLKSLSADAIDSDYALQVFRADFVEYLNNSAVLSQIEPLEMAYQVFNRMSLYHQHLFILRKMHQMKLNLKAADVQMRQAASAEGL
jgi:hypothetical protein